MTEKIVHIALTKEDAGRILQALSLSSERILDNERATKGNPEQAEEHIKYLKRRMGNVLKAIDFRSQASGIEASLRKGREA